MPTMLNQFVVVCALTATCLSGCSYIKSLFPDKEKDYQYTTEIAPLKLPLDIGQTSIATNVVSDETSATATIPAPDKSEATTTIPVIESPSVAATEPMPDSSVSTPSEPRPSVTETTTSSEPDNSHYAPIKHEPIAAELVADGAGNHRLRLRTDFDKAWRAIDKALSRKSLEVTDRNRQARLFRVQFDPDAKKLQDGSLLDEALFIFGGFQSNEKEYAIELIDTSTANQAQTDITLLDANRQPISDDAAQNLLKLIQKTIVSDFVK